MAKQNIQFTLIDETVVQFGFRVLMNGYQPALFANNPVMLLMHIRAVPGILGDSITDDVVLPIGRWNDITIKDGKLMATPEFDDDDELAVKVENKVHKGYLNGCSVALLPLEASDDPKLKLAGQTGPTITKWEIQEASIVDIPNCRNSLAIRNAAGKAIVLSDRDMSKKGDVLSYLKVLAGETDTPLEKARKKFNDERAKVDDEPRSARVQHLMEKPFHDLYMSGELQELREAHPKAFLEKYKEGTGKDHPDAAKYKNEEHLEGEDKEKPYTDEVNSLMRQSYHDLYMDGGLQKLKELNIHAFYKKYKEGIGKDHPDSKEAKEGKEKDKKFNPSDPIEVNKLMAKPWYDLWLSGESEKLFALDKESFFKKYKEGNGIEHPLKLKA